MNGADFKYENNFFKSSHKFTQKCVFATVFVLGETLKIRKFQSGDFKYANNCLSLSLKNPQIMHFCPKYEEFLFLLKNVHFGKLNEVHFRCDHRFFVFLSIKTYGKSIFVPKEY